MEMTRRAYVLYVCLDACSSQETRSEAEEAGAAPSSDRHQTDFLVNRKLLWLWLIGRDLGDCGIAIVIVRTDNYLRDAMTSLGNLRRDQPTCTADL